MNKQCYKAYQRLASTAKERLSQGDWRLRMLAKPAFFSWAVVGIIREQQSDILVARYWDREKDWNRAERGVLTRTSRPSFFERRRRITTKEADKIVGAAVHLEVALFPRETIMTLDGVDFELEVSDFQIGVHLKWNTPPLEWKPAVVWFHKTWIALSKRLEVADRPFAYVQAELKHRIQELRPKKAPSTRADLRACAAMLREVGIKM